jgi:hypothetical protein
MKKQDLRVWINTLAIVYGIAFTDGFLTLGIPEWVYVIFGLANVLAIYKLYKLTK